MKKLYILKAPQTTQELLHSRLNSVEDLMYQSGEDIIVDLLDVVYYYVESGYEGADIEIFLQKVKEAKIWYKQLGEWMDLDYYKEHVKITQNIDNLKDDELISYLLIGLQSETGEVGNIIKKLQFYKDLDPQARLVMHTLLVEELGDVKYYFENLVDALGRIIDPAINEQNIIQLNARKVSKIYQSKMARPQEK